MWRYIVRRLMAGGASLFGITIVVFILLRIVPGDMALAMLSLRVGEDRVVPQDQLEALRERLGLNRPLVVQYGDWLWDMVRGDLGYAPVFNRPVASEFTRRFGVTLQLATLSVLITAAVAPLLGAAAAVMRGSVADNAIRLIAVAGLALPNFLFGTLVLYLLVVFFNWFPPMGYPKLWEQPIQAISQIFWPALSLSFFSIAVITRMVRNTMLEVLREDYIRTAWAKGLGARTVYVTHALRNTVGPVITLFGLMIIAQLGGSVIIENIFNIQGLGAGLLFALTNRDYIFVQFVVVFFGVVVIVVNLLTDLAYALADPRIRLS